jgi:hypothetical protein
MNSINDHFTDKETVKEIRGPIPTYIELVIFFYVAGILFGKKTKLVFSNCCLTYFFKGFIWIEIKQLFNDGLEEYLNDL